MLSLLLVDDDPTCLLFLKKLLGKTSTYTIDIAKNGQTALHLFEKNHYDVLIMDLMMPGINGIDLARYIRADAPNTPPYLILITAYEMEHYRRQAQEVGVNLFLSKASGIKKFHIQVLDALQDAEQQIFKNELKSPQSKT